MASLLLEIQNEAIDSNKPLADILRKLLVLAYKISSDEIKNWVNGELNGYSDNSQIPEYRAAKKLGLKGYFADGYGNQLRNVEIPFSVVPKGERGDFWSYVPFWLSISVMEKTVTDSNKYDVLRRSIDPGFAMKNFSGFYKGMQCLEAWNEVPVAFYAEIIEKVRNKVLIFALKLSDDKDAMAIESNTAHISDSTKTHINQTFNTFVMGNVQNLAQESSKFMQNNQALENDTV